jgi:hypothetical protein
MTVGINQELAPIKFCFFIKPEMASLTRAIQVANCLWGGRNSPIFPLLEKFDKSFRAIFSAHESEEDFYKNLLKNFNPDIIILEDGLSEVFASKISGGRLHLSLVELEQSLLKLENRYGLTILEILYEIVMGMFEYKRNDDLHIHLATNENEDPLISILFNTPTKALSQIVGRSLEKRDFAKTTGVTIPDLHMFGTSNCFAYSDINLFKLTKQRSFSDHYEYVFIFRRDDLNSLTILWNLKAAGRQVFAFPISDYSKGELDEGLINFYGDTKEDLLGPAIFGGPYLKQSEFADAFKHIEKTVHSKYPQKRISHQGWIPRFGSDGEIAQKDGVVSSVFTLVTRYDQIKSDEGYVRYDLLNTDFKSTRHTYRKTHKVTSYIKYYDHLLNHPSVIDGIDNLDWVRMSDSISHEDYRISNGGIVRFCEGDRTDMHFRIPETSTYLKTFFKKNGLEFCIPAHGELTKQIFKNIGGTYGIGRFSSTGSVKVLEALENENILTYEHLVGLIKQHKPLNFEKRPFDFISVLLENSIIELGAQTQCTVCYQRSFYPIPELSHQLICKSCRSSFSPPQSNPKETFKWHYRGIGPFSKSNKIDGLLSGFLTLNLFEHGIYAANDGITCFMNFQLLEGNSSKEVDLILQLRNDNFSEDKTDLIFCECKTYRNFVQDDIDRMKFLGEKFPGAILVLSTLNERLTPEETNLAKELVNHFRKGYGQRPLNPVFVLTANELLPKNYYNAFKHFGEIHTYIRHNDYLGYLCEKSCNLYLGMQMWSDLKSEEWIAEQNKRKHIGHIMHKLIEYSANKAKV